MIASLATPLARLSAPSLQLHKFYGALSEGEFAWELIRLGKNIVILCDGTSNEFSKDRTNIVRRYGCLKKPASQSVFCDPGVGNFGAENSASYYYRRGVEIGGLATGWGMDANVKESYRFLVHNYRDGTEDPGGAYPDKIFIFGFSRGAFTARVLAGFIRAFGLLH